jgi:predicted flap endonuclease-1-like 5' DNA nuclease
MFSAPHILETALLLLAAFLIGCVGGHLLRRAATGRTLPAAVQEAAQAALAPAPRLVVAPRIAPLPVPASAVAELKEQIETVPRYDIRPARVAGETTSGAHVPVPVAPLAAPGPVGPGPAAPAPAATEAAAPIEISWSELSGRPIPPAPDPEEEEEDVEDAAMRAIEGGWTPRPAPRSPSAPVELPEPIGGASPAEIAGAMSSVRSAVAAAGAAAEAALLEHARPAVLADEGPHTAEASVRKSPGYAPFGRPTGLPAPRNGRKDDLRLIRGLLPQTEAALNDIGIFHFDQIAAWDKKAVVWIEGHFALKGRIGRDRWIEQARELAKARRRNAAPH